MTNGKIRVVARAKARAGEEGKLRELLLGLVRESRKESGCLSYELLSGAADVSVLCMVEEWDSVDALDRHMKTAHVAHVFANIGSMLAAEPMIERFTTVVA
jgi:quinol monooxygenase YgiN